MLHLLEAGCHCPSLREPSNQLFDFRLLTRAAAFQSLFCRCPALPSRKFLKNAATCVFQTILLLFSVTLRQHWRFCAVLCLEMSNRPDHHHQTNLILTMMMMMATAVMPRLALQPEPRREVLAPLSFSLCFISYFSF